mmetsp:Transcript_11586/g.20582  ORF Transcript_11586/g.20582 Transcript_11586/m.20582 type:complete len:366 (+) Transcript_11586:390-1487(+)
MFRSYARVVQACANRVCFCNLSIFILEQKGTGAMEHTGLTKRQGSAVVFSSHTFSSRFDTENSNFLVVDKGVEHSNSVGSSSDASDNYIGQLADLLQRLVLGLTANYRLEVTYDGGERVRADCTANNVVRGAHVRNPVTHSFVNRVLEGLGAARNTNYLCTENLHTENVECLSPHVFFTHVNSTVQVEKSTCGGSCYTVLTSSSLRDNTLLTNATCNKALSQGIVDLMCTGVGKILSFQPDFGSTNVLGQTFGKVQRRGPSYVVAAKCLEFELELGILGSFNIDFLKVLVCRFKGRGKEPSSEFAKVLRQVFLRVIYRHGVGHLKGPQRRVNVISSIPHRLLLLRHVALPCACAILLLCSCCLQR